MTDHPMLFSGSMVRAFFAGRKTKTRRLLTANDLRVYTGGLDYGGRYVKPDADTFAAALNNPRDFRFIEHLLAWTTDPTPLQLGAVMAQWTGKLRIMPKDRIWVRESVTRFDKGTCDDHAWYRAGHNFHGLSADHHYRSLGIDEHAQWPAGREGPGNGAAYNVPSIHMPKSMSRITLIVDGIKIERLRDISEDDAIAEGAPQYSSSIKLSRPFNPQWKGLYRQGFAELWNEINGAGAWEANPWVIAYSVTPILKNIDEVPAEGAPCK